MESYTLYDWQVSVRVHLSFIQRIQKARGPAYILRQSMLRIKMAFGLQ